MRGGTTAARKTDTKNHFSRLAGDHAGLASPCALATLKTTKSGRELEKVRKKLLSRRPESREDFARALPSVTNHGQEPQTSTHRSLFWPSAFDLGELLSRKVVVEKVCRHLFCSGASRRVPEMYATITK